MTLVHTRLWLESENRQMSDLKPLTEKIVATNGQPLRISYTTVLRFRIACLDREHKALIADDMTQDCLFGADFLKENGFLST